MLIWKPGNFRILIVGGPIDVVATVERRIGKVISLPIDTHTITFEEIKNAQVTLPTVDLILVDKAFKDEFQAVFLTRFYASGDFVPAMVFHLGKSGTEEEIELIP